MPAISIIVPVYKTPISYLRECVESLLGQTCEDIEIILVDDGSPDDCGIICDGYVKKDRRVKTIHQKNSGVSAARNSGIATATAPWVMFVDSDDRLAPAACQTVLAHAAACPADIHIFNFSRVTPKKTIKNPLYTGASPASATPTKNDLQLAVIHASTDPSYISLAAPWGKLYRASLLREEQLLFSTKLRRAEDLLFNLYALEKASAATLSNEYIYFYRQDVRSTTHKYSPGVQEAFTSTLGELCQFIQSHKKPAVFTEVYHAKTAMLAFACLKNDHFHKACPQTLPQRFAATRALIQAQPYKTGLAKVQKARLGRRARLLLFLIRHEALWPAMYLLYRLYY